MQTRLFNLFIKHLKNLNFDYIQDKILVRTDELKTDERFLGLKNQHPFFGITQTIFDIIDNHPEHEDKVKDIYLSYIKKSQISLSTPYHFNRNFSSSLDVFGYTNYILSSQTNEKNKGIIHTINNWLVESGLNYNHELSLPQPFIISMIEKEKWAERKGMKFKHFDYLKDFYFSNFDFSDINKNSKLIAKIISNFISSYSDNTKFSYSILNNFLTNDNIHYDKETIREGIAKKLHNDRYISSIKPKLAKILIEFNLDYIVKNNETLYLYPYFYNNNSPSQSNLIKYENKKGLFISGNTSLHFKGINQFLLQSLNIHSDITCYPEKYKQHIKINSYENFYDFQNFCDKKLITIKETVLDKKFAFIDKHNLTVDHTKLMDSFNSKIEEVKKINNLYSEDLFHDNFKAFINYHIKHIDYNKKEQPLLKTIHIINSLQKHKPLIEFINEKAKELSFTDKHSYKNINYSEIKNLLYPEKNQYLPHIDFEKLLSVNVRKNIQKVEGDFVYNGNSFYSSLFNKQGKYTSGMSEKRIGILNYLETINKIDNPYCIADGQKLLRSEHIGNIIIEHRLLDSKHTSLLLQEIKNENERGITFRERSMNTALVFLCFQSTSHSHMINAGIDKIREELYQDDNDFLQKLCLSFTLNKDEHKSIYVKKYKINNSDQVYNMVVQKIKSIDDNTLLKSVEDTILKHFEGDEKQKSMFKSKIKAISEKNTLNSLLKVAKETLPPENKERRRI